MPGMRNFKRKINKKIEDVSLQEEVNNLVKSAKQPRCESAVESANPVREATSTSKQVPRNKLNSSRLNESSSSESESLINMKQVHNIPHMLNNDDVEAACICKQVSNNLIFQVLGKINKKVSELNAKLDILTSKVDKITSSSTNLPIDFDFLPEDINLPITSLDELSHLNDKLKNDKQLSASVVRFLYNAGTGKTARTFILSLTKKVLAQEIAVQFSRYGRKGKRSFIDYNETLNVILAAAAMRFTEAEREDLAEMFGKSLAGASDWNHRKIRPSDLTSVNCSSTFHKEEVIE